MKYLLIEKINDAASIDCLLLAVDSDQKLILGDATLPKPILHCINSVLAQGDLETKLGSTLLIHPNFDIKRILLVRTDKTDTLTAVQYTKLITSAYKAVRKTKSIKTLSLMQSVEVEQLSLEEKITKNVIACGETGYQYSRKHEQTKHSLTQLSFMCKKANSSLTHAIAMGEACNLAITLTKELGNMPPNICTPTLLAKEAEKMARRYKNLTATILNEADMKKLDMNALLAVSKGSPLPSKFIILQYQGTAKTTKPIVLVGKGVTFDSGGISLKPPNYMLDMKCDMLGAASVLGIITAFCELNLKQNIVGIMPCVENMPDGAAVKPGDVVTSMAGIDIEILNTDAEGRLILCDALCYAKKFKPSIVIDLATLTGAAGLAFGQHTNPIMGNDQELVDAILKTFNRLGERTWQMPLFEEYDEEIKSKIADIANIAITNRGFGGIMHGGCFLEKFTKDYPWVHIDMASTAYNAADLSTGRPVAALIQFILNYKA